ncbi:MAG: hypothetical protein K8H88_18770, partial [Sandaracinaceae bacterium]|nr:hypothetical protein [Sandaracinaceae bacterium]
MFRATRALPFLPATFIALIPLLGGWQCGSPPTACTDIYAPVCGTDGVTYGNACYAGLSGVAVAHDGECAPQLCLSDADCGGGSYCNHDRCLSGCGPGETCPAVCYGACEPRAGCYSDADCGPGFVCAHDGGPAPLPAPAPFIAPGAPLPAVDAGAPVPSGMCVPVDPGCYSDADCAPGQTCVADPIYYPGEAPAGADRIAPPRGTCQYVNPPCTTDADCPAGQICELPIDGGGSGARPADPALIAPTGFCRDPGPTGCTSDSECGAGQRCDTSSCFAAPCEPGAMCTDICHGTCVPSDICWSDADCGPGRHCNTSGTTTPPPADSDEPGHIAPPAGYCEDDAACPPVACDLACAVFQTDANGCPICACAPTYCFADSDCAMGQT